MKRMRKFMAFLIATIMMASNIAPAFAAMTGDEEMPPGGAEDYSCPVLEGSDIPVVPTKPEEGKTAADLVKNPDQPDIYTLRTDYKVQREGDFVINYQPYIASVGEAATKEEKEKIRKTISVPEFSGYFTPKDADENEVQDYTIDYNTIVGKAKTGKESGDEEVGRKFEANQEFRYYGKTKEITVKHKFQDIKNLNNYTNLGGEEDKNEITTTQEGKTSSILEIKPLDEEEIKGFVPEENTIKIHVPNDTKDFVVEYRYNRAKFNISFDTDGGTELPSRTLYYGQTIPKLNFGVTKVGATLNGWKVSKDITYGENGEYTLSKDDLITEADFEEGGRFANGIRYAMPAEDLTFTADWNEKEKASYVIQFWTEKTDYDDTNDALALRDRYDFIGARRVDNADTGSRPELTNLDVHGITFPDLNEGRLEKAQDDKEEFERYYFLNEDLTQKQNASKKDPEVQKSVSSTGETVYNVYYDRRVYTLYFTAANEEAFDLVGSFWPIITREGQVIGKEGSPYKVDVRFNQSLDKIWPKDEEVSNLPPDSSEKGVDIGLIGWIINNNAGEQIYRDTPPYRLSAEDFIDAEDVMSEEDYYGYGHADQIPIKDGKTKKRDKYEISIGSTSYEKSVVHHIDIIKDDFDGKEQIDYDMSYWKSDTNAIGADGYPFILPHLQGFTLKQEEREAEWILEKPTDNQYRTINDLNGDRNKKTPFRSDADKIEYIDKFPWGTKSFEGRNAYNYANYTRNKYKLKLNNDPKTVKNDSEYGEGNILDVPYELPLNDLKLDTTHKPQKPNWVRDDWSFLGWALDPAGDNLVKDGNETKLHYDQILYAKWGEPDYKWKVTIDPNEGQLGSISAKELTIDTKKIKEGDVGQEIEVTYPQKESSDGNKQVFTVLNRQKLKELPKPSKRGYDFLGWEVIPYKKVGEDYVLDEEGSFRKSYGVPELYTFGNEVVSHIYLKAIWVPNQRVDVKVEHYFLDDGFNKDKNIDPNPAEETLEGRRSGQMVSATASMQDQKYLLASHEELTEKLQDSLKKEYEEFNKRVNGLNNSFYQNLRVEPEEITNEDGEIVENPDAKNNVFKFFYRPIRTREYKVNYIDESYKGSKNEKDGAIIPKEKVVNGNRHYDARNYKKIPGWVLTSDPQQQLFFNIDEDTNELIGINGTNSDEITFYYKDVRIIEVPGDDPVPDDYVRVTFKADEGGTFVDKDGNEVKEIHYDVIKGLPFGKIPRPDSKNANGLKIVPEEKYSFLDWERDKPKEKGLLKDTQCVNRSYTFTAKFEQAKGKLTVKKVFENEPVDKETTKMKKAPKKEDPIEFEFTITGPNKFEKTFTLKAGEEKTFEGLAYGDYTVEEIDSKDYTAYYVEGDYNKESSDLSDKPIKISLEKSEDAKTYTKSLTVVNKNIKPDPDKTNENIIDVKVKKIWDGGTKPATTIELWREGQGLDGKTFNEKVKEVEDFTTDAGGKDEQSYTFRGLPKHDPSGREFVYYAMEVTILENYEASYSDDDRLTITNTYTSPQTDEDVIGEKIWENVPDGKKIPTVKFELWRKIEGSEEEERVVKASELDDKNRVNFGKQNKTDNNGQDYIYFVKEVDEKGNPFKDKNYTPKLDGLTITNIYRDKIPDTQDIKATKIWKGDLEEKEELPIIYFKLYRKSASKEAQAVGDIMKIAPGITEATWKDMDIADDAENPYEYFVQEVDKNGEDFTPEGYIKEEKGLTVTNTKKSVPVVPEKTLTVKAIKTWQGGPETDHGLVNLQLLRKSSKRGSDYEVVDVSYTILEDGRTYIWENLPIKDEEDYIYTYKVLELGLDDNNNYYVGENKYLSTVEKDERNSTEDTLVFDLVNTYQEPQDPNQIIAYKKWVDLPSGITPPRVFFILQRNIAGEVPYDVEDETIEVGNIVNQDGFIEVDFGEQEEFDEDGNPYIYSVREVDIDGSPFNNLDYSSTAEGLYVVNKYKTKEPDPVPVPDPSPDPEPTPDPKPEPDPIIPGDDDTPQTPDKPDKPEEPETPEEPGKPEDPETPETPENPKPEKPKENIPEKPEKEKPPVKTENNKTNQTGTKIVKTINQTGTKIVRNVKNFLNPSTGIITNYEIYIGLMAASSVGLFFTREKKNKDDE